jgi:hypothetical protein
MPKSSINKLNVPQELKHIFNAKDMEIIMPETREELLTLAMGGSDNMTYDVSFDVKGKGIVREAMVTKCKNGISVNYDDVYMRRRDPDSMVIADDLDTDKATHTERFGKPFDGIRDETFKWFAQQKKLLVMPFMAGNDPMGIGYPSLLVVPANGAFFAAMMADIQGFIPQSALTKTFRPRAVVYVAPPFRHLHYDGKQVVIHKREFMIHEVFSYNLYPGPSAKKGIYGVLLNIGEQEKWVTLHASTVRVITPYELQFTILHEGASGGGKSEMIQPFTRQRDWRMLLAKNLISHEKLLLQIADACELHPVTDDMALCHPSLQEAKTRRQEVTDLDGTQSVLNIKTDRLVVADAEEGWFLRVNHIDEYGIEPETEKNTVHPPEPLIFLNINAIPGATALIWEPVMDEDGDPPKYCPNPRVIMPRRFVQNHVDEPVEVNVRSFGIRTPPCTKEQPSYGIVGIFHVLPPALAWLWRLVSPRGYANPSIMDNTSGLSSEGVGSYWPFATGKMVDQANLLLQQIIETPGTRYILVPNQHIGAYKVDFAGQWLTREYLARRGGVRFRRDSLADSRCPLLGYALEGMKVEGQLIPKFLLQVNQQPEVGIEGYDAGAKMLTDFFKNEIKQFLTQDMKPLGKRIIEACLSDARVVDYYNLIPKL